MHFAASITLVGFQTATDQNGISFTATDPYPKIYLSPISATAVQLAPNQTSGPIYRVVVYPGCLIMRISDLSIPCPRFPLAKSHL